MKLIFVPVNHPKGARCSSEHFYETTAKTQNGLTVVSTQQIETSVLEMSAASLWNACV